MPIVASETPMLTGLNKKMIQILMKIGAKINKVVENREAYCFIIIFKRKQVPLSLFSYQMLASAFDYHERSSYYEVCVAHALAKVRNFEHVGSKTQGEHTTAFSHFHKHCY